MKKVLFVLGLSLVSVLAHADETPATLAPIKAGDSIEPMAQYAAGVTQVSSVLKTSNGNKYIIKSIDYGPGSMAPTNLLVYAAGPESDIGGEAGYEASFYVEAAIINVKSFKTSGNDVVLKVLMAGPEANLVTKKMKLSYDAKTMKLTVGKIQ